MDSIFTPETIARWFQSTTDCDPQLRRVIYTNKFESKVPTFKDVSLTLFRSESPYDHYKVPSDIIPTPQGDPHIGGKTIRMLVEMLGYVPRFGVEVGSFLGASATLLGNVMKESGSVLLCVDTWCGDINMWLMDDFVGFMNKPHGNPQLFDKFMLNMINNKLTNTVIPLRVSSIVAARMLRVLKYEIDFVYVDAAHEAGETFMELMLYHDLLKKGGVLFGDDYHYFPAVKYDVDLFCKVHKYTLTFTGDGDTWMIKKT